MNYRFFNAFYPMLYRGIMAVLLVGIVINSIGNILGISKVSFWNWIFILWLVLLLLGINYGKANTKLLCWIALLLSVAIVIPLIGAGQLTDFWGSYVNWLVGSSGYMEDWFLGYGLMQTTWLVFVCYFSQIFLEKKQIFRDVVSGLLLCGLLLCMFLEVRVSHVGVACMLMYIVITYVQRMRKNWDKKKQRDSREYTIFLVPFLAAYLLILFYTPTSEKPYDWRFVKEFYENLSENAAIWWENMGGEAKEDFGTSSMGFSEQSEISGELSNSDKHIMKVKGDMRQMTNCYLRGKSYDTFTGTQWQKTVVKDLNEYPLDSLELLYAIKRYDAEKADNYVYIANLSIKYEYFNTGHLFAPGKLLGIRNMDYEWNAGDAVFGEQKGYGTEYGVSYYQLNAGAEEFAGLLESRQEDDESEWGEILKSGPSWLRRSYTLKDLESYRKSIKENYYQKVKLSDEVQRYLDEITLDCETDLQKLKAIEEELSGYSYTQKPGKMPEWVKNQETFLDYFLTESKRGFCAHFATAFVLLARAEGMPARYVEGFCVPLTDSKYMAVSSHMAHAWPEIYLEGIGWIPFEPTPGYGSLRYSGWDADDLKVSVNAEKREFVSYKEKEEMKEAADKEAQIEKQRVAVALRGLSFIVLICLAVYLIERLVQEYRYKHMDAEGKFLVEVRKNLWIFAKLGCKRGEAETLSELQQRIKENYPGWLQKTKEFTVLKAYQEYLYRNETVEESLLQEIQREEKELLEWVKKDNRRMYYAIRIGLFLRISKQ